MNRRQFLQSASALAVAAMAKPSFAAPASQPQEKLHLTVPVTHSDWMLKPGIEWGLAGVKHMLDACKAAGWATVLWRVLDAGQATYASKLLKPASHPDQNNIFHPATDADRESLRRLLPNLTPQQSEAVLQKLAKIDYGTFDSLAAAIDYGHKIGLKIHAWVTINEDDHGWGWVSEFSRTHPDLRWIRRDGRPYHSQLSFAHEAVRQYKLAVLEELLAYRIDGLFLDWIRTGDIRDNPQNDAAGYANYGYEAPNIAVFKAKYGVDPHDVSADDERWASVRAEPQTLFMRQARKLCLAKKPEIPLAVMVGHPWHYRGAIDRIAGNLRGLLVDVGAWAKEGLIDSAVAAGYYRDGGTPEKAFNALKEETAGKVDLWTYAWVPQNAPEFTRDADLAQKLGANRMLLWEADYIDDRKNAAELKAAMSARAQQ